MTNASETRNDPEHGRREPSDADSIATSHDPKPRAQETLFCPEAPADYYDPFDAWKESGEAEETCQTCGRPLWR